MCKCLYHLWRICSFNKSWFHSPAHCFSQIFFLSDRFFPAASNIVVFETDISDMKVFRLFCRRNVWSCFVGLRVFHHLRNFFNYFFSRFVLTAFGCWFHEIRFVFQSCGVVYVFGAEWSSKVLFWADSGRIQGTKSLPIPWLRVFHLLWCSAILRGADCGLV